MERRITRVLMLAIMAVLLGSFIYCGGGGGGGGGGDTGGTGTAGPNDLPGGASGFVQTETGGTITTANGISLEILPGALPSNTVVKLIPLKVSDENIGNLFVNGVRFDPEGTVLRIPAVVRMPLPAGWDGDYSPEIYEGQGNDPLEALPTDRFAKVSGQPGAYVPEVEVSHFSTVQLGRNCHKATIRRVINGLYNQGAVQVRDRIAQCYPSVDFNKMFGVVDTNRDFDGAGPKEVQALLDTYFADLGGWNSTMNPNPAVPPIIDAVPPEILDKIRNMARNGKQVVFAFKQGSWGKRSGKYSFLNPHDQEYCHTAVLEV